MLVAVRPSAVARQHRTTGAASSARNTWPGTVVGLTLLADRVRLDVDGTPRTLVDVTPAAVAELGLRPGAPVWLSVKATERRGVRADAGYDVTVNRSDTAIDL